MNLRRLGAFERLLRLISIYACYAVCAPVRADSTAFYYGPDVPRELLTVYDQVVVEPRDIPDVAALAHSHATLVAYVSIGEARATDTRPFDPAWVLGNDRASSSRIMDLTHPGYRRALRDHFEALWRAGYRRFFLDALDKYVLVTEQQALRDAQLAAIAALIRELAQARPSARFVLNRGFELLPHVAGSVHGVVAESLFDGWDAARGSYVRVPEQDRAWLLERLREVRGRYQLPVTVVDYRPAAERDEARATARRIAALGFEPWVYSGGGAELGIGALEIMPRRVLVLGDAAAKTQPGVARWLAPVLEYLGYVPEYSTPASLPTAASLRGRYAGIVTVFGASNTGAAYPGWLLRQVRSGVRVAIFGELGFSLDGPTARELGIQALQEPLPGEHAPRPAQWSARDQLIGFEADPPLHALEHEPVLLQTATQRHLELRLESGAVATAIATTSWGGLARSHVFAPRGLRGQRAWVLDPFAFLSSALALPHMPVPDLTTEGGGRVAVFAIDVEGAGQHAWMRGRPLVSEALLQLLSSQPWPHALGGVSHKSDPADITALQQLLAAPGAHVYPDAIRMGRTTARGTFASLTQLTPLYNPAEADPITAPIAPDLSYLEGSGESYAYQRVLGTFAFTDAPRRLRPIAMHYHAHAASSPGGVQALTEIYATLARTPLFVVRLGDYRERVRAFRQQVITRDLAGRYRVFGGEALRTMRVPMELGAIDLADSQAVAAVATLTQGRYVTFSSERERRLSFSSALVGPHLERANGRIERFQVMSQRKAGAGPDRAPLQVALAATAHEPLVLRFAGLPASVACALSFQSQAMQVTSDPTGRAKFALSISSTGAATLTCPAP